jgi:hypothetical protein
VVLCKWAEFSRPASAGPTTLGWWPITDKQGSALGQRRRWRRPCRLRLASGWGGKGGALGRLGNTAHPTGGSKKGGPHRNYKLCGDVRSAGGERRRGWHPAVMVDGSWCGKAVHGSAVLMAATGSSEGDRGWHYAVARRWWNKAAQWGQWVGGRKAVHGGVLGSLYSRWTEAARRQIWGG